MVHVTLGLPTCRTCTRTCACTSYVYVSTDDRSFAEFFGFTPDHVSRALAVNGDDAVELFHKGSLVDAFGFVSVDGTGEAWDYSDGWAYRRDGTYAAMDVRALRPQHRMLEPQHTRKAPRAAVSCVGCESPAGEH